MLAFPHWLCSESWQHLSILIFKTFLRFFVFQVIFFFVIGRKRNDARAADVISSFWIFFADKASSLYHKSSLKNFFNATVNLFKILQFWRSPVKRRHLLHLLSDNSLQASIFCCRQRQKMGKVAIFFPDFVTSVARFRDRYLNTAYADVCIKLLRVDDERYLAIF